ncbi:nuclear transport factor 2 family protein [Novosphingobium profundi]|uniref:nuclear transport factor 2 family protein n=1 Tax=Novosphingobium profundi TaxID=1774954 RepID=UPI001BDB0599|nr:nuclear transport factor 2 family protein [Novosphingobium profundi]MBT0666803.1 nuclear transport factor 2 family protein [Novosphingobium profundi]
MLPTFAKTLFATSALACLTLGSTLQAAPLPAPHGTTQSPAQAQLQARYTELKAAMESRSAPRIKAMLAPGFASTLLSGKTVDADTMIAELARVPQDPDRKTQTTLGPVTVSGNLAKVEQTMTASALVKGHAMKLIAVSDDVWEHGPQGWQLKTTTSKDMTVTQDGKVIRHAHLGDPKISAAAPTRGKMGPVMTGR